MKYIVELTKAQIESIIGALDLMENVMADNRMTYSVGDMKNISESMKKVYNAKKKLRFTELEKKAFIDIQARGEQDLSNELDYGDSESYLRAGERAFSKAMSLLK